ncbi:hypothetical protein NL676_038377 [Syzygium grande]|nr:hypothetical protein NL676_038377 [Syzygium grande]
MAVQSFSQLIARGEEIESGLKKGWCSESGSSGKRFTSKKDKEHVPEVNMTYVQKMPAQAPKLQFITQQTTSYERQGQQDPHQRKNLANITLLPGTLSQVQGFKVPFEDMFDALVRASYVSTGEVVSFGEIEKKVDELVREGMIETADEFEVKAFMPQLRQMDNPTRLVWDIMGREAADKTSVVTEAEEEQVKVPYHLPLTTPFAQLE